MAISVQCGKYFGRGKYRVLWEYLESALDPEQDISRKFLEDMSYVMMDPGAVKQQVIKGVCFGLRVTMKCQGQEKVNSFESSMSVGEAKEKGGGRS